MSALLEEPGTQEVTVTDRDGNFTTHQMDANAVSILEAVKAGGIISTNASKPLADRIADLGH